MSLTTMVESMGAPTSKVLAFAVAIFAFCGFAALDSRAQAINEGFDNVSQLPSLGWFSTNVSQPLGASTWSQCGGTAIPPAHSGASTSCALVNFNSTTGVGTISNWLIAPTVTLNNGDTFSFYTKTPNNDFPDRLQVRLSTNGSSTNVGGTATSVGDFTTLLLDINPTYGTNYPETWTQFTVTVSGLAGPTSGRLGFRYFVEAGGPSGDRSNIIGLDTFVYTPNTVVPTTGNGRADFDGDGRTDIAVFRPSDGFWYLNQSTAGSGAFPFGIATDVLAPGDYDGDGKTDAAVFRANDAAGPDFYILNSSNFTLGAPAWGSTGDIPAVADYDGDGKTDIAIYRPSEGTWYILRSSDGGNVIVANAGTKPVPADYDGDGKAEPIIFSNGTWTGTLSGGGTLSATFGIAGDVAVPGDYDGDGKVDLAVFRPAEGNWYILQSSGGTTASVPWGLATDVPVPGDYDGDGKDDVAIYRDGTWWINRSTSGVAIITWGIASDKPVPAVAAP